MAKTGKGWLTGTVIKLLRVFRKNRFQNRLVSALPGTSILMDSSGSPVVPISALDRFVASVTGTPLLQSIALRAGLDLSHLQSMPNKDVSRMIRTLSGRRSLQLFYVDATTNNSQLLTALLEEHPDILEQLVRPLTKDERHWVLQLFGEPAPQMTAPAAENCALLLSRLNERKNIVPILNQLLSNSNTNTEAAALRGLFYEQQLDFGLLAELSKAFSPAPGQTRDEDRNMVTTCFWNAQKFQSPRLANHLQVFMNLMYQSLPQYRNYWAQCTGLPAEDCPVSDSFPSLGSNLTRLTPSTVDQLCKANSETDLVDLASKLGWKKIQSRSSATLRNPDAATGDFIFRTFSELQPQWQASPF